MKMDGEGVRGSNARGSFLVEFCTEHDLINVITWFKNHERSLYMWRRQDAPEGTQLIL